jgi:hypothetical protein
LGLVALPGDRGVFNSKAINELYFDIYTNKIDQGVQKL